MTAHAASPLLFRPTADVIYGFPRAQRIASVVSPHQHIEVWQTPQLGTLFTLDGRPMTSVGDEFIYHECMVHPATLAHPQPKKALVLGGGDGGAARQLLMHPGIERIVVAELDEAVVQMARQHLFAVHRGAFDDARVELVMGDAGSFVAATKEQFDVVVFDLTPPDSPAAELYTPAFYARLKAALAPRAALSMHLGAPHFHAERVAALLDGLRGSFAIVDVISAFVPLYGSLWLMAIASDTLDAAALFRHDVDDRLRARRIDGLRYYSAALHPALFTLPHALRDTLGAR
ncbi:polyamine aminopropyltransferase [Trinickia sp. LjRoot230]|uniref:polyamine aminopropyltransferase n=1 Tax=Trinickia sp. LjRoot230 TaxID=3342288 RepID=UPI003ECD45DE